MTALRITVLGTGSVGLAMAATYARAQVTVLARGASVAGLHEQGITVMGVSGDYLIDADQLTVSDADDPRPQDLTCDDRHRADQPHALNVQASQVRVGTLFAESVSCAGVMKQAVALGQAGFLPIACEHPMEPAILDKLLFNTCLNAIGAITRMGCGELVSNPHAQHLITHLDDETIRVIRFERRFELAPDGATYVEQSLTPPMLPKAAAHRSSMLQDVEAGRRTEIDHLSGGIVRLGR